jgi:hypothetical protein
LGSAVIAVAPPTGTSARKEGRAEDTLPPERISVVPTVRSNIGSGGGELPWRSGRAWRTQRHRIDLPMRKGACGASETFL